MPFSLFFPNARHRRSPPARVLLTTAPSPKRRRLSENRSPSPSGPNLFDTFPPEIVSKFLDRQVFPRKHLAHMRLVCKSGKDFADHALHGYLCIRGVRAMEKQMRSLHGIPQEASQVLSDTKELELDFEELNKSGRRVSGGDAYNGATSAGDRVSSLLRNFRDREVRKVTIVTSRNWEGDTGFPLNPKDLEGLSPEQGLLKLTLVSLHHGAIGRKAHFRDRNRPSRPERPLALSSLWLAGTEEYSDFDFRPYLLEGHLRVFEASVQRVLEEPGDFQHLQSMQLIRAPECSSQPGRGLEASLPTNLEHFSAYGFSVFQKIPSWKVGSHLTQIHLRGEAGDRELSLSPIFRFLSTAFEHNYHSLRCLGLDFALGSVAQLIPGELQEWTRSMEEFFPKSSNLREVSMSSEVFEHLHRVFPTPGMLTRMVLDLITVDNSPSRTFRRISDSVSSFLGAHPSMGILVLRAYNPWQSFYDDTLVRQMEHEHSVRLDWKRLIDEKTEECALAHPVQNQWDQDCPGIQLFPADLDPKFEGAKLDFDVETFNESLSRSPDPVSDKPVRGRDGSQYRDMMRAVSNTLRAEGGRG